MGTHKECLRHLLLTLDVRLILGQKAISVARKKQGWLTGGSGKQGVGRGKSLPFVYARVVIQKAVHYIGKEVRIGG